MDLFTNKPDNEPLASRMRPRNLDEYIGQDHIVGPGRLLRRAIKADQLSSLIFYGPPGTGKTTLAHVIAGTTSSKFITINAVLAGVKQIREAIEQAATDRDLYGKKTILFVDEVHRWNKAQQDALLPWVENGTFILIGATTENPYFEVNAALVSRSRIFQLVPLNETNLKDIVMQALLDTERGYGNYKVEFEETALEHIIKTASGDARSLLNAIQLAVETSTTNFPPPQDTEIYISLQAAEESIQKKVVLYDKEGDYHYDTISAFIKSIRGSDPDAAIYWLARMIRAGENPRFIFRRLMISACEDVGLANPEAVGIIESSAAAFDRIGMPEGSFLLSHCTLYLASSPKSNSTMAVFDAIKAIEQEEQRDIPAHLKDPSRDKHGFGHGEGYAYPHAYKDHWVAQQYLPKDLAGRIFYKPSNQGYESKIQESVVLKREAQLAVMLDNDADEVLTFSPVNKNREQWIRRTSSGKAKIVEDIRNKAFSLLNISRHNRILISCERNGLFLLEAFRKVPEGGVWAFAPNENSRQLLEYQTSALPSLDRPVLIPSSIQDFKPPFLYNEKSLSFEQITGQNTLTRDQNKKETIHKMFHLLSPKGQISLAEILPRKSTRLSSLLEENESRTSLLLKLQEAEKTLYTRPDNPLVNWDEETLRLLFEETGFTKITCKIHSYTEKRFLSEKQIDDWLSPDKPESYGAIIHRSLLPDEIAIIKNEIKRMTTERPIEWKSSVLLIQALRP